MDRQNASESVSALEHAKVPSGLCPTHVGESSASAWKASRSPAMSCTGMTTKSVTSERLASAHDSRHTATNLASRAPRTRAASDYRSSNKACPQLASEFPARVGNTTEKEIHTEACAWLASIPQMRGKKISTDHLHAEESHTMVSTRACKISSNDVQTLEDMSHMGASNEESTSCGQICANCAPKSKCPECTSNVPTFFKSTAAQSSPTLVSSSKSSRSSAFRRVEPVLSLTSEPSPSKTASGSTSPLLVARTLTMSLSSPQDRSASYSRVGCTSQSTGFGASAFSTSPRKGINATAHQKHSFGMDDVSSLHLSCIPGSGQETTPRSSSPRSRRLLSAVACSVQSSHVLDTKSPSLSQKRAVCTSTVGLATRLSPSRPVEKSLPWKGAQGCFTHADDQKNEQTQSGKRRASFEAEMSASTGDDENAEVGLGKRKASSVQPLSESKRTRESQSFQQEAQSIRTKRTKSLSLRRIDCFEMGETTIDKGKSGSALQDRAGPKSNDGKGKRKSFQRADQCNSEDNRCTKERKHPYDNKKGSSVKVSADSDLSDVFSSQPDGENTSQLSQGSASRDGLRTAPEEAGRQKRVLFVGSGEVNFLTFDLCIHHASCMV